MKSVSSRAVANEAPLEILESVLEAAGDGLMDWNFLTGEIKFSPRWKAILGFEPTEIQDSPSLLLELSHPADRDEVDRKILEYLDAMWPFVHTWRLSHKDGSWRWLLARAVSFRSEEGNLLRVLMVFSDITYRVLAERRMAALIAAVPDFIIRVSREGAVRDANLPVDAEDRAPPTSEVDIHTWVQTKPFARPLMEVVERVTRTGTAERCDIRTEVGEARELEAHVAYSDDGEAVCVVRDITARRQMEAQAHQSQRLEAIGQLAAGIAHEINTPIQFIGDSLHFVREATEAFQRTLRSYRELEVLRASSAELADALDNLKSVEEECDLPFVEENVLPSLDRAADGLERVTTIVRSMKEFAHPGQNQRSTIDLNHAVETTLTIARNEYKYVADVETEFGELPLVPCFPGELNQVILNIVVNAAHAIGEVVGNSGNRGRIGVTTHVEGESVVIAISDSGGGFPPSIQDRIFDPFFTTKDVGKGTGQGLALARSIIVQKHRGSLTFKTAPEKGTTFFVRLPLVP